MEDVEDSEPREERPRSSSSLTVTRECSSPRSASLFSAERSSAAAEHRRRSIIYRARSTFSSPATSSPATLSMARSASRSSPPPPTPTSPPRRSSTACGTPSAPSWLLVSSVDSTTSTSLPERRSCTSEPPREPRSPTSLMSSDLCVDLMYLRVGDELTVYLVTGGNRLRRRVLPPLWT